MCDRENAWLTQAKCSRIVGCNTFLAYSLRVEFTLSASASTPVGIVLALFLSTLLSPGVPVMLKKLLMLWIAFVLSIGAAFAAVDVNTADQTALESVKGLGPVKSKAIIDERTKNGPFKDADDLATRVKGLGAKSVTNLEQAGLTVGGSSAPPTGTKAAKTSSMGTSAAPANSTVKSSTAATAATSPAATTATTPAATPDAASMTKGSKKSKKAKAAAAASGAAPAATATADSASAASGAKAGKKSKKKKAASDAAAT
jgi:competence protein ComEA